MPTTRTGKSSAKPPAAKKPSAAKPPSKPKPPKRRLSDSAFKKPGDWKSTDACRQSFKAPKPSRK